MAATAVVCVTVGLGAAIAIAAGQKFKTSLARGKGDALVLRASSKKVFESYAFKLKKQGYEVTKAVLVKEDGKPTHDTRQNSPCQPAQNGAEAPKGNWVVCPSLLYFTGKQQGVKSIVIDFNTNKCYPAGGGVTGTKGPKGSCKK